MRAAKVEFTPHFYEYEEKGGTAVSSRELKVDEHAVVKTLVMADDNRALDLLAVKYVVVK